MKKKQNSVRLAATSWGFNSEQRAGNLTVNELFSPRQVQRSSVYNFISCAAGKHHTLLVSDEGIVYSIGDGRKGQLGYGNPFTENPEKGGILQATPRHITPTGLLKFGRDLQCFQVAAGGTISVAREPTPDEGSRTVEYFLPLENAMIKLVRIYNSVDTVALCKAWSFVRHERFLINKRASGLVLTWGTGKFGELGLGKETTYSPYPQVNFYLRNLCITHISVGERHVLAVDSNGRLFSWGYGGSGRLGHGDMENKYRPELVSFFLSMFVISCAAGDAHSVALTIARDGGKDQRRKVLSFGRGAHGRLGYGSNRSQLLPVLLRRWPPSVADCQIQQIACGGAHSLALLSKEVPHSLAFPFCTQTFVLAWGYGSNGQLGTGYETDSFLPVRVRLPKAEVIVEVAAGRSWSIARNISGQSFSWGKGLRGQLGQGKVRRFSLGPRPIETHGAYLHLSAGYAHNVGIIVPSKILNKEIAENRASAAHQSGVRIDPFEPSSLATFKRSVSKAFFQIDCCRRITDRAPSSAKRLRFHCLSCSAKIVCYRCALVCHARHRIYLMTDEQITSEMDVSPHNEFSEATPISEEIKVEDISGIALMDFPRRLTVKKGTPERRPKSVTVPEKLFCASVMKPRLPSLNKEKKKIRDKSNSLPSSANKDGETQVASIHGQSGAIETPVSQVVPTERSVPTCHCALFNQHCRSMPTIAESPEEILGSEPVILPKLTKTKRTKLNPTKMRAAKETATTMIPVWQELGWRRPPSAMDISLAQAQLDKRNGIDQHVVKLQALGRGYNQRVRFFRLKQQHIATRREVVAKYVEKDIFGPVWNALAREYGRYRESIELKDMQYEDDLTKRFVVYKKTQSAVLGLRSVMFGLKSLIGMGSIQLPVFDDGNKVRKWLPSFAFSWSAVREQQLWLHPRDRYDSALLAQLTQFYPRLPGYFHKEGTSSDPDVTIFLQRYLQDSTRLRWTVEVVEQRERREKAAALKKEKALEALRKKKAQTPAARAANLLEAQKQRELQLKAQQEALDRQREAALSQQQAQQTNSARPRPPPVFHKKKEKRLPKPSIPCLWKRTIAKLSNILTLSSPDEDKSSAFKASFNSLKPPPEAPWIPIRKYLRRHTISDPTSLYARITKVPTELKGRAFHKRRNSEPALLSAGYPFEYPDERVSKDDLQSSLSMFKTRLDLSSTLLEDMRKYKVANVVTRKNRRDYVTFTMRQSFGSALLNPRLPREMNELLLNPARRRSIGEPERLIRQLQDSMDAREFTSSLVDEAHSIFGVLRRRRSFDLGEAQDEVEGITDELGIYYEPEMAEAPTLEELAKDLQHMRERTILAGYDPAATPEIIARSLERQRRLRQKAYDGVSERDLSQSAVEMNGLKKGRRPRQIIENGSVGEVYAPPNRAKLPIIAASQSFDAVVLEPEIWQQMYSDEGDAYYYFPGSGESRWDLPEGPLVQIETQHQDEYGQWYWFNNTTGAARWFEF